MQDPTSQQALALVMHQTAALEDTGNAEQVMPSQVLSTISYNHMLVCLLGPHALLGILCAVYGRLYSERYSPAAGYAWCADASSPAVYMLCAKCSVLCDCSNAAP